MRRRRPCASASWTPVSDATAAGGQCLNNANAGAALLDPPLANPDHYFEMSFTAQAGPAYRLWIRGKAFNNSGSNDSVWVQFDGSVNSGGYADVAHRHDLRHLRQHRGEQAAPA